MWSIYANADFLLILHARDFWRVLHGFVKVVEIGLLDSWNELRIEEATFSPRPIVIVML